MTLLSDQRPPIKDAFAWIKLVQPLYKRGFSVVLLDLPGSGGSGLNTNTEVPYEDWEEEDFRIVENALRGLQVKRTHLIAFGRSSRIILKFAKNTHINGFSTFLEREHCWYQPDIDFFALFHNEVGDCPPGKVHEWQIEAEHRHEHLLREVMKPVRIMAFHERFPEDPAVKATQQFIARARSSPEAALSEFYCTRISREDICFVRPHAALDVSIMAMAKNLMTAMADFLKTANQGDVAVPVFLPHQDVKDGKIKQCSKGCVNPRRGLHHWSCPNHPKNAGGRGGRGGRGCASARTAQGRQVDASKPRPTAGFGPCPTACGACRCFPAKRHEPREIRAAQLGGDVAEAPGVGNFPERGHHALLSLSGQGLESPTEQGHAAPGKHSTPAFRYAGMDSCGRKGL